MPESARAGMRAAVAACSVAGMCLLGSCAESSAVEAGPSMANERTELAEFLYANSGARVAYWDWQDVPAPYRYLEARLRNLPVTVPGVEAGLFSVSYPSTNLPQFTLLLRRPGNTRLLVYNHGHFGLPLDHEPHAIEFLRSALLGGHDLLITSMPLTGLNAVDDSTQYFMAARGRAQSPVSPVMLRQPRFQHELYEALEEHDHYLHHFIDGAVIPASIVDTDTTPPPVRYAHDPSGMPPARDYDYVSYVGLSGGASVGLTACALHRFDRCILIAGVMPNYLRLSAETNWGDSEQITRSFYHHFDVQTLLAMAKDNSGRLVLLYNRFDPCCFADPAASTFAADFPGYDIRVTELTYHGYVAADLLTLLQ